MVLNKIEAAVSGHLYPAFRVGAEDEIRTRDPLPGKELTTLQAATDYTPRRPAIQAAKTNVRLLTFPDALDMLVSGCWRKGGFSWITESQALMR